MSLGIRNKVFNVLTISVICMLYGCSSVSTAITVSSIRSDPEGTREEQVTYHQSEIKKYEAAASKEQSNANRFLKQFQMNDVRQANSRKLQYIKKIEEHMLAIEELQEEL